MPFEILHLAFPGWGLFWTGSLGCSWPQSLQLARLPDLLELGTIAYLPSTAMSTIRHCAPNARPAAGIGNPKRTGDGRLEERK